MIYILLVWCRTYYLIEHFHGQITTSYSAIFTMARHHNMVRHHKSVLYFIAGHQTSRIPQYRALFHSRTRPAGHHNRVLYSMAGHHKYSGLFYGWTPQYSVLFYGWTPQYSALFHGWTPDQQGTTIECSIPWLDTRPAGHHVHNRVLYSMAGHQTSRAPQ